MVVPLMLYAVDPDIFAAISLCKFSSELILRQKSLRFAFG